MRNQVFKKLFSVLLALIMVAGLLPASAMAGGWGAMDVDTTPVPTETVQPTESAEPTAPTETETPEEPAATPEVTEVPEPTPENPAATVEPTQGEPTAEPTDEGIMPANVMPVQANVELQYRIVHLDCGREYFTKDWIIALINEMAEAGYNQLQLAFGNGGFRFYLNDMAIGSHSSDEVKNALEAGNAHYNTYGDSEDPNNKEWISYAPKTNALTETEMKAIIDYAREKGIEIVPMLNTPGHMHAVLAAMSKLGITGDLQVSDKPGCLNLSNTEAVAFTKALVEKYVDYFAGQGCKFFNFAMDEYSSFDTSFFTYANYLIAYANTNGITPRVFNDALSRGKSNGFISGTQVCCWDSVQNTNGYSVINTSHDFYYVSTNEAWNLNTSTVNGEGYTFVGDYAENSWITHAEKFNNNKFLYKGTSSNISPVGSMFCIWCNTPGKNTETQIAQQIRMILRVIGARMKNENTYKASNELVEGGFKADGTIYTSGSVSTPPTIKDEHGREGKIDVAIGTSTRIYLPEGIVATWTVTEGKDVVELVAVESDAQKRGEQVVEFADAAPIIGNAVMVKALKTGTATVIATLEDGTVITATVEAKDNTKKHITVVEGKTVEIPIDGNHEGTYDTINPEIATVTAKYAPTAGGTYYDKAALGAGTFYISNNGNDTNPTMTVTFEDAGYGQYYIKNSSGQYIYPNATYSWRSGWSYKLDSGKQSVAITSNENDAIVAYRSVSNYYGSSTTTAYLNLSSSSFGASGSSATLYIYDKKDEPASDKTTLAFTGHKVGTTTVTIAGVEYTIEVKAAELENVVLPINLWITNTGVVPTNWSNDAPAEFSYDDTAGNRRSIYTLKASHSTVNSPNGISLSSILPQVTGTAKSWDNNTYNVTYWKSAYHTAENRQSTDGWTNYSHKGTKFEYIRFYEGSWAYSVDGITWVNIENVGAGATDTDKNQVCIWYRQVTTVTSEVTTEIVDWGPIKYGANQCLLDFAVKYDGTSDRIPNSFPATGKTIGFDCPTNQAVPLGNGYVVKDTDSTYYRTVYGIAGVETAAYEVYMITLTPSSDSHTAYINNGSTQANYKYKGTEKIAWAKTEADANSTELNKMPNVKYGGEPFLESVKIYQYQGLLVTYYLRAKQTPDSLTVHYAIQGSETAFYEYNIAVNQGTTFDSGIALDPQDDDTVGGPLLNGEVINSNNETITVSSELATLQGLEPQYRYSKYKIVDFRKDDKNVWIYYTFTREHTYVIDFGLPLKIKFSDFGVTNDADIKTVSLWEKEIVLENKGLYGTAKVIMNDTEGKYVLYTLDKPLDKNITIPLYVKFSQKGDNDKPQLFTANIIPATNVYYEDSFAKFYGSDGKEQTGFSKTNEVPAQTPGVWYIDGQEKTATQALEALGEKTNHNVYGYDPAYQDSTMFSMGSARKVTVTNDMAKDGVVWPTAQFTFKGTGFDIISLTDNTSGAIFVFVYKGTDTSATGTRVRSHIVDNYYGYTQDENGNWVVNNNANNVLYQIPVMRIRDLEYGEYTAVVKVFYDEGFNHTTKSEYSFWLDAVRVYDPMGESVNTGNTYGQDGEAYPQYIKLRSELKKLNSGETASSGALFIDGKENANISEYANYGPNNEVYLAKGQAIMFKLAGTDLSKIETVQIGAKAPNGTAKLVVNNGEAKVLGTATEMYYDITMAAVNNGAQLVTVTNTGEAILSLTNLKITYAEGNQTVSLGEVSAEQKTQAVQMVRALFAPAPVEPEPEPEPEKTFEPERFEASWNKNVMQGKKATLTVKTSEDVEAITVDGQTIRSYRTRTERVGFGRRAKRITYREFTYSMVAQESADFSVTAINAEGTESEAITTRLTVKTRPNSLRDMWDWFKGWF